MSETSVSSCVWTRDFESPDCRDRGADLGRVQVSEAGTAVGIGVTRSSGAPFRSRRSVRWAKNEAQGCASTADSQVDSGAQPSLVTWTDVANRARSLRTGGASRDTIRSVCAGELGEQIAR